MAEAKNPNELIQEHTGPDGLARLAHDRREIKTLVSSFGWLCPWLLSEPVHQLLLGTNKGYRVLTERRPLPSASGGCWPIFVSDARYSLLATAFVLPLVWRPGSHDPHLPKALANLADRVVEGVKPNESWGLHLDLPENVPEVSLTDLDLEVESAWASLVGGLQLAQCQGAPNPRIWTSIAWHPRHGVGRVDDLHAKLNFAAQWGATQMFVSNQNPEHADWNPAQRPSPLEIKLLPAATASSPPSMTQALSDYLKALEAEPAVEESYERRAAYYRRTEKRKADNFYWTHMLGDVIRRCQEKFPILLDSAPRQVATVVSNLKAVVSMAPAVLNATRCLLFFEAATKEKERKNIAENRDAVVAFLKSRNPEIEIVLAPLTLGDWEAERAQIKAALSQFLAKVAAPEQFACDLTPGYKSLSFHLRDLAPLGSWLLYCRHNQESDFRVILESEHYDARRKGSDDGLLCGSQ